MHAVVGTAANRSKVCGHVRRDLQGPGTGMADKAARYLKQPPAHRGDAMPLPALAQSRMLEQHKEVMGDDADPEESGIGAFLATGHAFHAKADFEFLDAIFGMLSPLAVPDQHIRRTAAAVAGDDVVAGPVFFQEFSLMDMAYHDEAEGFVGVLHTMHGLRNRTVGPGSIGNGGDGRQGVPLGQAGSQAFTKSRLALAGATFPARKSS